MVYWLQVELEGLHLTLDDIFVILKMLRYIWFKLIIMKVLLDIKDSKAVHLLEVLKSLPYVKTTQLTDEKAELMSDIREAVEEMKLIRQGKLKGIPARDLLDEL
jgi:hypothetical protein